jgi:hypothetical protein
MSDAAPVAASIRFASTDIVIPIPKGSERIRGHGRIRKARLPSMRDGLIPTSSLAIAHTIRGALNGCQEIGGARG